MCVCVCVRACVFLQSLVLHIALVHLLHTIVVAMSSSCPFNSSFDSITTATMRHLAHVRQNDTTNGTSWYAVVSFIIRVRYCDVDKTIACYITVGRVDNCLHAISAVSIHTLRRAQSSIMARAATNSRRTEHNIKQLLASLHWLPVGYWVQHKLAVTTFKVLTTQ